jgi:hypothetical protein
LAGFKRGGAGRAKRLVRRNAKSEGGSVPAVLMHSRPAADRKSAGVVQAPLICPPYGALGTSNQLRSFALPEIDQTKFPRQHRDTADPIWEWIG